MHFGSVWLQGHGAHLDWPPSSGASSTGTALAHRGCREYLRINARAKPLRDHLTTVVFGRGTGTGKEGLDRRRLLGCFCLNLFFVCVCVGMYMYMYFDGFYFNACFLPNFDDEDVETRTGDDRNDSLKRVTSR